MDKKSLDVMFSKKSDHWATPKALMNLIEFDIDVCPLFSTVDSLAIDWPNHSTIYCNPPYSDISSWIEKIIEQVTINSVNVKLLIPARTDTKYFHRLLESGLVSKIIFFKGRLRFNEANSAPFPSILIYVSPADHIEIATYDIKLDITKGIKL